MLIVVVLVFFSVVTFKLHFLKDVEEIRSFGDWLQALAKRKNRFGIFDIVITID